MVLLLPPPPRPGAEQESVIIDIMYNRRIGYRVRRTYVTLCMLVAARQCLWRRRPPPFVVAPTAQRHIQGRNTARSHPAQYSQTSVGHRGETAERD